MTRGGGLEGAADVVTTGVLGQILDGSGSQRSDDRLVVGVGGEHDDLGGGMVGPDAPGGLDPIESGHAQVHQDDIGRRRRYQGDGFVAVAGGADHLDAGLGLQQGDEPFADHGLVVGHHHPHDGTATRTVQPGPLGSAWTWPPNRSIRSRMPGNPNPPPVSAS